MPIPYVKGGRRCQLVYIICYSLSLFNYFFLSVLSISFRIWNDARAMKERPGNCWKIKSFGSLAVLRFATEISDPHLCFFFPPGEQNSYSQARPKTRGSLVINSFTVSLNFSEISNRIEVESKWNEIERLTTPVSIYIKEAIFFVFHRSFCWFYAHVETWWKMKNNPGRPTFQVNLFFSPRFNFHYWCNTRNG